MVILPAIDIIDGECVRLVKGEYNTAHKVAENAVDTAKKFQESGAKWIHMVDLNGAKSSKPENADTIFSVKKNTNLNIEVGGGIRNIKTIDYYVSNGISRVILGSAALNNPKLVTDAVNKYGDKIAVGIDSRNGKVAVEGWTKTSNVDYLEFAKRMEQCGVKFIIFTDISLDGTLSGPNVKMLKTLNDTVSCNIIASGGISSIEDISNLLDLKLYGAICGKAIYSGNLDLKSAVELCRGVKDE